MDQRLSYLILAMASTLIFLLAVSYDGWDCGGCILGRFCSTLFLYQFTGGLLLTALVFNFFASVCLMPSVWKKWGQMEIVASVLVSIAAIAAMVGTFYYTDAVHLWLPFLATIAMSLTVVLAVMMLLDIFIITN